MSGKKGMVRRKLELNAAGKERLTETWKAKISASTILDRLKKHGDGDKGVELTATQLKAYDMILSRLVPTLSAVEQTNIDERDKMSEADIVAQIQALIQGKPELRTQLLALLTGKPQAVHISSESVADPQQIAVQHDVSAPDLKQSTG